MRDQDRARGAMDPGDLSSPGRSLEIETHLIATSTLTFEVDMCGDGEDFALLLHGFPEAAYSWRHQLPLLKQMGFTAWAPNLRGYGRTERPPKTADYHLDRLREDVAALVDAAGARTVTLIAHDWGGVIAWDCAIRRTVPIDRLVVMNAPHPRVFHERMNWEQRKRSWYMAALKSPWLAEWGITANAAQRVADAFAKTALAKWRFSEDDLDVYRDNALGEGAAKAMADYYRANIPLLPARRAAFEAMPAIEAPTLLIWGEADTALALHNAEDFSEYAPDLTIRRIPAVSHWVQQEAPETVNAMLKAFLSGEEPPLAARITGATIHR